MAIRIGPKALSVLKDNCAVRVFNEVISVTQERALIDEIDPLLSRRRFQRDHWDQVIVGYKEIERSHWINPMNESTVMNIRDEITRIVTQQSFSWLPVHIIELEKEGFITPHVDSIKFSGGLVCGLSLLSPAVMKLSLSEHPLASDDEAQVHLILPPRSLYILSGAARYDFAHSIEKGLNIHGKHASEFLEASAVLSKDAVRDRRISLIFRDEIAVK